MLRSWLLDATDDAMMFSRFGAWLASQLEPLDNKAKRLQALELEPSDSVETLAQSLNVSGPTLRRSFAADSGMSPKRWLILRRIDKILRDPRLADPESSLAHLAADYGYSDQAHLAREMMRFAGTSPTDLRKRDANFPPHMRSDKD